MWFAASRSAWILALACAWLAPSNVSALTLEAVKARGTLVCGVSQGIIGFSSRGENGEWEGLDADFCRALAAAIFDDPAKVEFVPLSAEDRFKALQSKSIDVLSRNSSWTMSRETGLGLAFAGRQLLRRSGVDDAPCAQPLQRARTRRQQGLRPERHHDRAEPAGLFPRQQHELRGGRDRVRRRIADGLQRGPMRCRDGGCLAASRRAAEALLAAAATTSCRKSSPRSRSDLLSGRTISNGSTS